MFELFKAAGLVLWRRPIWVLIFGAVLAVASVLTVAAMPGPSDPSEAATPNGPYLAAAGLLELVAVPALIVVLLRKLYARPSSASDLVGTTATAIARIVLTSLVLLAFAILVAVLLFLLVFIGSIVSAEATNGLLVAGLVVLVVLLPLLGLIIPVAIEEGGSPIDVLAGAWEIAERDFGLAALSLGGTAVAGEIVAIAGVMVAPTAAPAITVAASVTTTIVTAGLLAVLYGWPGPQERATRPAGSQTIPEVSGDGAFWKG
jgi:hypothetical protein